MQIRQAGGAIAGCAAVGAVRFALSDEIAHRETLDPD
jgi:hypothetical protein